MMFFMLEFEKKRVRVFLFGVKLGVVEKVKENLLKQFKNLEICGVYYGYFSEEENNMVLEIINFLKVDVLFVVMGMKKQEEWIYKNKKKFKCKFIMGVGGSFDVLLGEVKRVFKMF